MDGKNGNEKQNKKTVRKHCAIKREKYGGGNIWIKGE